MILLNEIRSLRMIEAFLGALESCSIIYRIVLKLNDLSAAFPANVEHNNDDYRNEDDQDTTASNDTDRCSTVTLLHLLLTFLIIFFFFLLHCDILQDLPLLILLKLDLAVYIKANNTNTSDGGRCRITVEADQRRFTCESVFDVACCKVDVPDVACSCACRDLCAMYSVV